MTEPRLLRGLNRKFLGATVVNPGRRDVFRKISHRAMWIPLTGRWPSVERLAL